MATERSGAAPARGTPTTRRGALAARLAAGNPSRLLYGAVVSSAVLAVVGEHGETAPQVLLAVVLVLTVYWLAHVYVETLAGRLGAPARGPRQDLWWAWRHEAPILLGGVPALLVLAVSFLLGASVSTATNVALWVTVALLAGAGYLGGYRTGRTGWRLLADTLVVALIGVLTILLKTLLH
ncbi:hypothetical protein [Pseudonocardia asaccharolytica]|uniref:Integral membrane protein n=1 Tax=Pseudonocardia asaccharolytica DSM 44247 = NBRC 16224 TaxID=1123024 RepID=A0A511D4Q4_9PSEU|nr:hypothetical protein [Pseudonocardia asaccharolytica]GEL19776.1 hypothetical protein PA7_36130 [Pseudonocardia asaccharolytica DSM 44247 = NBRC 16224]